MDIRLEPQDITNKLVQALIQLDQTDYQPKDEKLREYYEGDHDIKDRTFKDATKPNNKIVTNFCKYITDVYTGYFIGVPVSYSSDAEQTMERLQDLYDRNDEQSVNARLAKYASIYGYAAEIVYSENEERTTPEGERTSELSIKFDVLNPEEQRVIFVYDTSIEGRLWMAIRYYDHTDILTNKTETHAYVYTDSRILTYKGKAQELEFERDKPHYFKAVPIIPYYNKGEGSKGDFADVMTLNDAYNLLQSDDINESNYSNDAYLVIKGMVAQDEDVEQMKEKRVLEVTEDGEADWLIKSINDTWKENLKTRIEQDIHKVSGAPNLSDDSFSGQASGVAIEYKLKAFEDNRASKERSFKKSLRRRLMIITNILNLQGNSFQVDDVQMRFSKNLPKDESSIVDQVVKLSGTRLVSRKTLRSYLPMIENPVAEEERIQQEEDVYQEYNQIEDVNDE